jgi:hypothetical protein
MPALGDAAGPLAGENRQDAPGLFVPGGLSAAAPLLEPPHPSPRCAARKDKRSGQVDEQEKQESLADFRRVANMSASELERWLQTPESREAGWRHEDDDESVGHRSGRRVVEIKRRNVADLSDEDYAHMRKVIGYVHRHRAQGGPQEDKEHSRWRASLMTWGHDPLK